nr:immunoglobulin heavy chain junction region [Macaca mulatta]
CARDGGGIQWVAWFDYW